MSRLEEIKARQKDAAYLLGGTMIRADWNWLIEQAERVQELERFKEYFDELYGQGLEVAEWHMNGDLELFDNFYDGAIEHMEGESK